MGHALREIRKELGVNQAEAGAAMGLEPARSQQGMSVRERPDNERYYEATIKEIARFEDYYGLERGTVLRRAGYVTEPSTPPEQVDSWSGWLGAALRGAVKRMIEEPWEQAGRPGLSHRRR